MAKLTLTDITSGYALTTTVNANNALVEAAIENTLSRDGSTPNTMSAALDMNSYNINNLPDATQNQQPITLAQAATLQGFTGVAATAGAVGALIWPRTTEETAQGVTPSNYEYEPGDIRRYGAGVAETAGTNDTAIANALLCNDLVRIPHDGDGSVYEITSSFTLGRHGQRVVGDGTGNSIATESGDGGTRLSVQSGFPTAGGDAAQAVFNLTSRNQRIENISIDCNNIALYGVYGTGGLITRCGLHNMMIQDAQNDGVKFVDSTFMNSFENVVVPSPGRYGFNIDYVASGNTTVSFRNCYVTSAGTAGFYLERTLGFTMDACACDSTAGYAVVLEGGCTGTIDGMDTESTEQIIDMSDATNLPSRVVISGSRFLSVGNASPVANIITNGGTLTFQNNAVQTDLGSTAFLVTASGSKTYWFGNSDDIDDITTTINAGSYVKADNITYTSNNSAAEERVEIRSTSTPKLELFEIGQASSHQIVEDGGVLTFQRVNSSTKAVQATWLTYSGNALSISTGSSGTMSFGAAGTDIGFYGATPVALQTGVAVTAGGIHAALVNLGLITA